VIGDKHPDPTFLEKPYDFLDIQHGNRIDGRAGR
jgi:hypothetical protein